MTISPSQKIELLTLSVLEIQGAVAKSRAQRTTSLALLISKMR